MDVAVFWEILPADTRTFAVSLGEDQFYAGLYLDDALHVCRDALAGDALSAGIARELGL